MVFQAHNTAGVTVAPPVETQIQAPPPIQKETRNTEAAVNAGPSLAETPTEATASTNAAPDLQVRVDR